MTGASTTRRALLALALALASCADAAPPANVQPPAAALYGSSIRRIVVEVDYAPGAAPFTGGAGAMTPVRDLWAEVFAANARRLFRGSSVVFEVPDTLARMEALPAVGGPDFTASQVLAVARAHRQRLSGGDTATFYVLFLDGYLRDASGRRGDVLGASIGDTGVIAMFKPVITGLAPSGLLAKYMEQSTLVHEFGHAVGLVNNGVALTSPHQDAAHGAHCASERCVMNHSNEGAAGLQVLVRRFTDGSASNDSLILFDEQCLADAAAAIAAARR